jgi:hypothetical protein
MHPCRCHRPGCRCYDLVARPEQGARRYHVVSRFQLTGECAVYSRHAGCNPITGFSPLQQRHALFEHRHSGIAITSVNINIRIVVGAIKTRFGGLWCIIDKTGVEIERFRGFPIRRPFQTAAHKLGCIAPTLGVLDPRPFGHGFSFVPRGGYALSNRWYVHAGLGHPCRPRNPRLHSSNW